MTVLRPAEDASPADWLLASVATFAESVTSLVPAGFEAYVRIFDPGTQDGRRLRWAEIAARNGRVAHAGMQLSALVGDTRVEVASTEFFEVPPSELPLDLASVLVRTLGRHTGTPDRCWFAVWHGWHSSLPEHVRRGPIFRVPNREYHLLSGPVAAAAESVGPWPQPANLWWPDDHAWCVATEIYSTSTYVACSAACADELLVQSALEAYAIDPSTGVAGDSDSVN